MKSCEKVFIHHISSVIKIASQNTTQSINNDNTINNTSSNKEN